MNEIKRESYLQQLASWKDKQIIKVITGIRRSGKSTLLMQFQKELLASGISKEQIISIRFEEMDNDYLLDAKSLYAYLKEHLCADKQKD